MRLWTDIASAAAMTPGKAAATPRTGELCGVSHSEEGQAVLESLLLLCRDIFEVLKGPIEALVGPVVGPVVGPLTGPLAFEAFIHG